MSEAAKAAQRTVRAERSAARGAARARRAGSRAEALARQGTPTESAGAAAPSPLYIERNYTKLGLPRARFRVSAETTDPVVCKRRAGVLDTLADAIEAPAFFAEWQALPVKEKWGVSEVERVFRQAAKGDADTAIRILRSRKTFRLEWDQAIARFDAFERARGIANCGKQQEHLETYAAFAEARTKSKSVRLGSDVATLTAFFSELGKRGAKALLNDDPTSWVPVVSSTQNRYRSTFRKFFGFVAGITAGVVDEDVLRKVPTATGAAPTPRFPRWTPRQRHAWLQGTYAARVRVDGPRRRYEERPDIGLALRCLFYTGLDVGDVLQLTTDHFLRLPNKRWIVKPGVRRKTAKRIRDTSVTADRETPLPHSWVEELLDHVRANEATISARNGRLFGCTVRQLADAHWRLITPMGFGETVDKAQRISMKDLRHVAPVKWITLDKLDLHSIAQRLGHAGLGLVHIYTRHLEGRPSVRALIEAEAAERRQV